MPEALAAIPTLQIPTGNSSETETTTTDRSTTSAAEAAAASSLTTMQRDFINSGGAKKKHQQLAGQKKSRKSLGRRTQKKPQLKVNSQQKTAAAAVALNIKSQIPRALLLTPSSSSTSLTTNASLSAPTTASFSYTSSSITSALPLPAVARPATPRRHLQLQRQNTATILNFRIRKSISSISQMDLRRSRRGPGAYQLAKPSEHGTETEQISKSLVANDCSEVTGILGSSSQTSLVNKILDQDSSYYYVLPQDRDPRIAGMRIFATIMLNAWRKRRVDVKRLSEEVNDLKRGSIKAKNQLHVFNTLFRVEQKRNDELNCQLKRSLEDINKTKSSCESLTTSLISLKADRALLEQQIQIKEQEFDGINTILSQTKSDLFKSMALERELQANLSDEQRKVQMLENQKNELINEICELNNESLQKEESLREELGEKDAALKKSYAEIKLLQEVINDLKDKDGQLHDYMESENKLKNELENLKSQVNTLQQCLAATVGNRLKTCWNNSISYQRATLQLLHWVAFCALPATPPPKISHFPFGLTLEKALSIVKR